MNIIVSPYAEKNFYYRPDSTLIRAITDYYIPDYVAKLSVSPILFIKMLRPGKAIGKAFASRYIDTFGYGLLLHPEIKETDNSVFIANSLDYTSIIPLETFPWGTPYKSYKVEVEYVEAFSGMQMPAPEDIYARISEISGYCSLRIGDFIAFETALQVPVDKGYHVSGSVECNSIFELKIR